MTPPLGINRTRDSRCTRTRYRFSTARRYRHRAASGCFQGTDFARKNPQVIHLPIFEATVPEALSQGDVITAATGDIARQRVFYDVDRRERPSV